jgi:anaerobic magnesium-protoporphyrin IX monomethyl ester cyclase
MMPAMKSGKNLRILFINLNPRPDWTRDKTLIYFNIGLCQVMTHVRKCGYDFDLLDFSVEPMRENDFLEYVCQGSYDVAAFGGMVHALWQMAELSAIIKRVSPRTQIVVGGYATMLDDDRALRWTHADVAIRGEGEYALVEVLQRIEQRRTFENIPGVAYKQRGTVYPAKVRTPDAPLDHMGFPEWDLFDVEAYVQSGSNLNSHHLGSFRNQRFFPVITTRGCPYSCTFCSNNRLIRAHNPYRRHSPEFIASMVRELHDKHRINHFKFLDELSFLNKVNLEQLIAELAALNLDVTFEAICRVGLFTQSDLELAERMKSVGFTRLFYSLESGSPKILELMNKKITVEDFSAQKRVLDMAGISSGTNVIVGYPTETEEDIDMTFNVCYENRIMPSVCFLLPIPGSEMYEYALREGYIKDEKEYIFNIGEQQYLKVNMTGLTDEQLYARTTKHLIRIRDAMELNIPDENLICSVNIRKNPYSKKTLFIN